MELKAELTYLEQNKTRIEVYTYLRSQWINNRDACLCVLVIDEMVNYLMLLESGENNITKDEYSLYKNFFEEAVSYGLDNCINDKLFLWLMVFYLSAVGTYYYIIETALCKNGPSKALDELCAKSKHLFPQSIMFRLIHDIQSGNTAWKSKISDAEYSHLKQELDELDLQGNYTDRRIVNFFQ